MGTHFCKWTCLRELVAWRDFGFVVGELEMEEPIARCGVSRPLKLPLAGGLHGGFAKYWLGPGESSTAVSTSPEGFTEIFTLTRTVP